MDTIFSRVSVRAYENRPVEAEKVDKILRAAMAAPSAMNQQPWEFYVVTDKAVLKKLSGASPYAGMVADAPIAIVPCCRRKGMAAPDYADIDLAIATENILLEIDALGLGGVMIGTSPVAERMKNVSEILNLPADITPFTIIPFGYPKNKQKQQDRYDASRVHYVK